VSAVTDRETQRAERPVRVALAALILIVILLVAVGAFASYRVYHQGNHRFIGQAAPLFAVTEDLAVEMLNQETGVRGYVITANPNTLGPYNQGKKYAAVELALIAKDASFDPRIPADLKTMRAEVNALSAYFASEIALVKTGPAGQKEAQERVLAGKGHFDHLRAASGALIADAAAVVKRSHSEQRSTLVSWWIFLAGAGLLAVAIAAGLLLRVPRRLIALVGKEHAARRAAEETADAARALTHVREAVLLLDESGNVRYRNPTAEQWFELPDDAAGSPWLASALETFHDAATTPRPVTLQAGDRWLTCDQSGFPGGRVVVLRDVSDDQRLERLRADFVATAAHELRTPLAAVYGAVRTLREHRELPPETSERFLEMIESEADRLKIVMDQLLVSAQLDSSALRFVREPVDAAALCESLINSAELRRPDGVDLALETPDVVVRLDADPDRLRQVVANLIDNAIKYSPNGGQIRVRVFADGTHGAVEVVDHGVGIPAHEHQRIFEKFYRLDPSMTQGVGGSGLGLYISRGLVREMGGDLTVESHYGSGSTFTVTLPLASPVDRLEAVS
jgi:signal transduction histidine kinase